MTRIILFVLLIFSISSISLYSQDSDNAKKTYQVATAEGTKTETAEEVNKGVAEKLRQMNREKTEEREKEKSKKNTFKIISRIVSVAAIIGGIALWRNRRKNKE